MAKTAKLYSFKDHPEHKAQLKPWAHRWISNALSTAPMTEEDREVCRDSVEGLYRAAGLEPPPRHRIVFVPSPLVLRLAGGFASAIWHSRKTGFLTLSATLSATRSATRSATASATLSATDSATRSATYSATRSATDSATDSATRSATDSATDSATRSATRSATASATLSATLSATDSATDSATRSATDSATYSALKNQQSKAGDNWHTADIEEIVRTATDLGVGVFGLMCAQNAYNMWQGGNQWSAWDSYLSFFQDVAKLPLDYSKYQHWRTLAERSGPRIMHPDFCMISDRPEVLSIDDQNRPHGETGPFCRWRDGFSLYAWHGTNVPARWIEERASLDPREVIKAANVETRAAGAAIVGWPRMLDVLKVKVVDTGETDDIGQLIELTLPGLREPGRFLKATCPRNSTIVEGVPRSDDYGLPIETALHAQAWRVGLHPSEYIHPEVRT